jgi:hypothetical protein
MTQNHKEKDSHDSGHRNLPESTTEDWEIAFEKKFEEHPEEEFEQGIKEEKERIIHAIDKLVADKGKLAKVEDVLEIVWEK